MQVRDMNAKTMVTFRYADENDCALILSFIRKLAEYEKMSDQVVATEELLREWIYDRKKAEVLFVCENRAEVGFALFFHNFSTFLGRAGIYLEDLFVLPEHRGKGYGKALLKKLAQITVERGCGRLEWACLDWNRPSIDFYLSLGAKPLDTWTTYRLTGTTLQEMAGGAGRVNIRPAVLSDLEAITRIYDEIHTAEENGERTIGWIRDVYPTEKTAEASIRRGDMFVLEDGRVLGTGIINRIQVDVYENAPWEFETDKVCVLHTLVISPKAAGKGYGRAFVNFYEQWAAEHGLPELRIDTNARNTAARAMYRKLGYKEIGIVPTTFNGIPGVDLVLLEKNLGPAKPQ